jgi:hypothetical protein
MTLAGWMTLPRDPDVLSWAHAFARFQLAS